MQSATAAATAAVSSGRETEEEILEKHERLIRSRALRYFAGHGVPLEDLLQEGRIALIGAARRWDSSHGAALWTYARKFVLGAMFRLVEREINEPSKDLDEADVAEGDEFAAQTSSAQLQSVDPTPEEIAEMGEDLAILEQEIDRALSDDERRVLWQLYGECETSRDAAESLGTSHGFVTRTKLNALEKLRARMAVRA